MPAIKSPAKILKLWKLGNKQFLEDNKLKQLEDKEEALHKKIVKGLERLRKVAADKVVHGQPDAVEFSDARDETTQLMDRFRKLFKPKKAQPKIKPFYTQVCRLFLTTELLDVATLDATDGEVAATELNDIDESALDKRDELVPTKSETTKEVVEEEKDTPLTDEQKWLGRRAVIEPLVLQAIKDRRGDVPRMTMVLNFAVQKAESGEFAAATKTLETLNQLLMAGKQAAEPGKLPQQQTTDVLDNQYQKLQDLLKQKLLALKDDPAGSTGVHCAELHKIKERMATALSGKATAEGIKSANEALAAYKIEFQRVETVVKREAELKQLKTEVKLQLQEVLANPDLIKSLEFTNKMTGPKNELVMALSGKLEEDGFLKLKKASETFHATLIEVKSDIAVRLEPERLELAKELAKLKDDPEGAMGEHTKLLGEKRTAVQDQLGQPATIEKLKLATTALAELKKAIKEVERAVLTTQLGDSVMGKLTDMEPQDVRDLVAKTGAPTLQTLAATLDGPAIRKLTGQLAGETLKKLANNDLTGTQLADLADTLDKTALETMAQTLTGKEVLALTQTHGAAALKKLSGVWTGTEIKSAADALGKESLGALTADLDGDTVKKLYDDLGGPALKNLAGPPNLSGTGVNQLHADLGKDALLKLGGTLTGAKVKTLNDDLGKDALKHLATDLTGTQVEALNTGLGKVVLKKLATDLTGAKIESLKSDLNQKLLKKMATGLDAKKLGELHTGLDKVALKKLGNGMPPATVAALYDDLGKDALEKLSAGLPAAKVQQLHADLGKDTLKKLAAGLDPAKVFTLYTDLGKDALIKLSGDLDAGKVQSLYTDLGKDALKNLGTDLTGKDVEKLNAELGKDVLKKMGTDLTGKDVVKVHNHLGTATVKKMGATLTGKQVQGVFDKSTKALLTPLTTAVPVGTYEPSAGFATGFLTDVAKDLGKQSFDQLANTDTAEAVRLLTEKVVRAVLKNLPNRLTDEQANGIGDALGDVPTVVEAAVRVEAEKLVAEALKTKTNLKDFTGADFTTTVGAVGDLIVTKIGDLLGAQVCKNLTAGDLSGTTIKHLSDNVDATYLNDLALSPNSGVHLKEGRDNFGSDVKLAQVVKKGKDKKVKPTAMLKTLNVCKTYNGTRPSLKNPDKVAKFFEESAKSDVTGPPPSIAYTLDWDKAVVWLEDFANLNAGPTNHTPGAAPSKGAVESFRINLPNGLGRNATVDKSDLSHFKTGHTFEGLAFDDGNFTESDRRTLWPKGTSDATIQDRARRAATHIKMTTFIQQKLNNPPVPNFITKYLTIDGIRCKVGVDSNTMRVTQFYPEQGEVIHRDILKGIKAAIK